MQSLDVVEHVLVALLDSRFGEVRIPMEKISDNALLDLGKWSFLPSDRQLPDQEPENGHRDHGRRRPTQLTFAVAIGSLSFGTIAPSGTGFAFGYFGYPRSSEWMGRRLIPPTSMPSGSGS